MANNVSNKKFTNPALNRYDVMQHVRNLYDIVGVTDTETFEKNNAANMSAMIDKIRERTIVDWHGTMEEFKRDRKAGLITDDMVCAIDDYVGPEIMK